MNPYEYTRRRVDLTAEQVETILENITFLPGWEWETVDMGAGHIGIRVGIDTIDRDTETPRLQCGRTWWIEPVHSEADVIRTVFLAISTLFEHELRERFTYDGRRVFAPHGRADETPWPDLAEVRT